MAEVNYTDAYVLDLESVFEIPEIDKIKGRCIFITGATGLIGSCLADMLLLLNEKHDFGMRIYLAGRNAERISERYSAWHEGYENVPYDTSEAPKLPSDTDYVIHCAGNAHPIAYSKQPVETALGIIQGVTGMLEGLRKLGRGRLLFVSSSEVYGQRFGNDPFRESDFKFVDTLSARSCYPNAKRMAETLCAAYRDEFGVDFVVARPGHVYGPTATEHDTRAHAQFARKAAAGKNIVMKSDGLQLRSYCYCIDCATALISILLNGISGEAYNVANRDSNLTVRQLADCFAEAGGVDVVFEMPSDIEEKGYNPMSCSVLNSAKVEALGWHGRFDAVSGAQRTVESLRGMIAKGLSHDFAK